MKVLLSWIIGNGLLMIVMAFILMGCADDLAAVNREVNKTQYVKGVYDCRHFAEAKYRKLEELGYKDEDMLFTIGGKNETRPHVVLNVKGVVLDNNYNKLYYAKQVGLTPENWFKYRNIPM